jgi:hypothetical protein
MLIHQFNYNLISKIIGPGCKKLDPDRIKSSTLAVVLGGVEREVLGSVLERKMLGWMPTCIISWGVLEAIVILHAGGGGRWS